MLHASVEEQLHLKKNQFPECKKGVVYSLVAEVSESECTHTLSEHEECLVYPPVDLTSTDQSELN